MGLFSKKKQPRTLYFLFAVADRPLEETEFKAKDGIKVFFATGEVEKHDIIPRTTLKQMVEKFINQKAPEESGIQVTERQEPATS